MGSSNPGASTGKRGDGPVFQPFPADQLDPFAINPAERALELDFGRFGRPAWIAVALIHDRRTTGRVSELHIDCRFGEVAIRRCVLETEVDVGGDLGHDWHIN